MYAFSIPGVMLDLRIVPAPPWITITKLGVDAACEYTATGRQDDTRRPAHAASRRRERGIFWVDGEHFGACLAGRVSDVNKVFGQHSFPLRMKSPSPSRLRGRLLPSPTEPLSISLYLLQP